MVKLLTVGLSLATPLFNQLVQAVISLQHVLTVISYTVKPKISLYIKSLNATHNNINLKISASKTVKYISNRAAELIK